MKEANDVVLDRALYLGFTKKEQKEPDIGPSVVMYLPVRDTSLLRNPDSHLCVKVAISDKPSFSAAGSSRWCGVVVRRGGASSGIVHVT
ncbi:hypothetical protein TNCV_2961081 [Trichonephila clavipes]|nr:hypothetical protein TNCV_2961081 [Trichonephila clavipes]